VKAFSTVITTATKSEKFSIVSKVYQTSTNQISGSYHEPILSY